MGRRFHGQAHWRGGFDIDESTLSPNANYWRDTALGQYNRLRRLLGEEKANHMTDSIEGTWLEIFKAIEVLADLADKQVNGSGWIDDSDLGRHVIISGGEVLELG